MVPPVPMDTKPPADGNPAQRPSYLLTSLVNRMVSCYYFYESLGLGEYENGKQGSRILITLMEKRVN